MRLPTCRRLLLKPPCRFLSFCLSHAPFAFLSLLLTHLTLSATLVGVRQGEVVVESKGVELNRLARGDCFGELALLTGAKRNATVRCESAKCCLLSMGVDDFWRLMKRSSAVHKDLSQLGSTRRPSQEA